MKRRKWQLRVLRKAWLRSAAGGLLLATLSSGLAGAQAASAPASEAVGSKADTMTPEAQRKAPPDFALTNADGQRVQLSALRGRVVLLDFWATWCGGCKVEIPWYVEFDKKYRTQGLAVIGVSMDDGGMSVVKPFLAQKGIRYPVVMGNEGLAKQYKINEMPVTLLIDRQGRIAVAHTGVVDKDNFESHIKELLK